LIKKVFLGLCCALSLQDQAQSQSEAAAPAPIWNELKGEELQALKLTGDVSRGAEAFQVCQGCHKHDGTGSSSGAYPRLAGQHATVLIKQITDIRAGRRVNIKMAPYADEHVLTVQEIADIASYLAQLPIRKQNWGQGPGTALARGQALYAKDCAACHGERGQGHAEKFMPLLMGQHYAYVLREVEFIQGATRGNANPEMVKVIKPYSVADLEAVADYISRMPIP
jgi:cytochrome c553